RAKDAQQAAAKSLADADESLKQVTTARDQAKQTLAAIELVVNSAVPGAKEPSAKALEAVKSALAALATSLTAADTARKQADAAKQNADKAAAEAEKTSATQKVDYSSPAPTIVLSIVPAPVDVSLTVTSEAQLKRGQSVEIKAVVKRQNGF